MSGEDLITISALQHYLFCPRQCALIHVDGLWAENRLTAEGSLLHQRVDQFGRRSARPFPDMVRGSPGCESGSVRVVWSLPLLSRRLGLVGKADCVEIPVDPDGHPAGPPKPVEHKRGRPKRINADRVQLCAQALCLEEMFAADLSEGALYYNATRRREIVTFDQSLRSQTMDAIEAVRELIRANSTPPAEYAAKCRNCSLVNLCLPKGTGRSRRPSVYLRRALDAALGESLDQPP
ncbi:MAG: CRISPR-associated protein Cas4 [Planctomycetota bacterium]|nr:MAG: CRISPR-associated protein Cas4 [Planctomycetota bacterium]